MKIKKNIYDYKIDLNSDTAPARVVRLVGKGKRVLEVGAGPGSITKVLSSSSNCRVTALDIDAESIKMVAPFCERAYQANLNDIAWPEVLGKDNKFEVLVAADVLEHVYEPLAVLKTMKGLLDENGCIILSIPHAGHSVIQACLFDEDFEYGDFGLLDRTHIRFFGIKNIQKMIEDAGLKIIHSEFVVVNPLNTEFSERWVNTPKKLRRALASNPFGMVYQVIVKAKPVDADGNPVKLINLPVSPQKMTYREVLRVYLRLNLSSKMYSRILEINKLRHKYFVKK